MNTDILEGKWKQLKGAAKREWGDLTNDEVDQIDGDMERLSGLIQERYGKSRQEAEKAIEDWCRSQSL
ncbi:MAG: CsbD family protein [Sneathiella sp.]|nr:CsbD family protein [Sneathiella sp.]